MFSYLQQLNRSDSITAIVVSVFLIGTAYICLPLFVEPIIYTKVVLFVFISLTLSIVMLSRGTNLHFSMSPLMLWMSLFLIYTILWNVNARVMVVVCILETLIMLQVFYNLCFSLQVIKLLIRVFAAIMLIICMLQFYDITPMCCEFSHIVGTFDNSVGLSAFFSLCFPFVWDDYLENKNLFALSVSIAISIVTILLSSRCGIISVFITGMIALYVKNKIVISGKKLMFSITIGFCLLVCILFIKGDSTLGRMFIIWQSLKIGLDNLFLGSGFYGFTANYMNRQANYFQCHPESLYANLADEISHPLNEYIALFIYGGLIGVFLLTVVIWQLWIVRSKQCLVYYCCLISVAVLALFTYALRYPFVWFFIVLSISQICRMSPLAIIVNRSIRLLLIVVCFVMAYTVIQDVRFEYLWHKAFTVDTDRVSAYQRLDSQWNGNPYFLYNYAAVLCIESQLRKSNRILAMYNSYIGDYQAQLMMADNYYALANYEKACHHYNMASFMCPVRFLPLRGLLRTYKRMENWHSADSIAHLIVKKVPKVNSYTVSVIKIEAQKYLNNERKYKKK